MTGFIETDEPEGGFVDAAADGEETVVLEDAGFVGGTEGSGDGEAFGAIEDDAAELSVDGVRVVEAEGVLGYLE